MGILINDNTARVQYTATAGQTVFPVPFEFFENADLRVFKNNVLQTITTHYTVTGAGVTGGGSITLVSGAAVGDIVTVSRDTTIERTSDFPLSGPFRVEALNTDLDRLTLIAQEADTKLEGRVLKLADGDQPNMLGTIPVKSQRAGGLWLWDENGNPSATGPMPEAAARANAIFTWDSNGNPGVINIPATAAARANGMLVFNSAGTGIDALPIPAAATRLGKLWYWNDSASPAVIAASQIAQLTFTTNFQTQTFTGNGTSTQFTLSSDPILLRNLDVFINGSRQIPTTNYTVSGTMLNFTTAPANNAVIFCKWGQLTEATGGGGGGTGNVTYSSNTAPSASVVSLREGDLWYDTASGNKPYRWSGSAWVAVQDGAITTATTTATNAQTTAATAAAQAAAALATANDAIAIANSASDGGIESFFQSTPPTAASLGDLWFDTDDNNQLYRYNGTTWVAARDGAVTTASSNASSALSLASTADVNAANASASAASALLQAAGAQATADGKIKTFYTNTQPSSGMSLGDLWYQPSSGYVKRWSGSAWQDVATLGADWAANLAGVPGEFTDGRVAAAISSSGNINSNKVTTAAIVANAVTGTSFFQSSSQVSSATVGSYTTVQTLGYTTAGNPLLVNFAMQGYAQSNGAGSYGYSVKLFRDTTLLVNEIIQQGTATASGQRLPFVFSLPFVDQPPAGTYTYKMEIAASGGATAGVNALTVRNITVTELKR